MKINLDCIPCFQKQALQATRFITNDEKLQQKVLREVITKLLELDWKSTSPELAHKIHCIVKRITNEVDPYKIVKKENNDLVLKLYPKLEKIVLKSKDPLRTAFRLAIAGNIIDFGVVQKFNLEKTISEVLNKKFAINDYEQLDNNLEKAATLLC